jgi:transcriptional regulator with GAF, ATPase, and Fis domain
VRELQHVLERAVIMGNGGTILKVRLPEPTLGAAPDTPNAPTPNLASLGEPGQPVDIVDALLQTEHRLIIEALRAEQGVQARAARRLGISRSNLNYRIRKLHIVVKDVQFE